MMHSLSDVHFWPGPLFPDSLAGRIPLLSPSPRTGTVGELPEFVVGVGAGAVGTTTAGTGLTGMEPVGTVLGGTGVTPGIGGATGVLPPPGMFPKPQAAGSGNVTLQLSPIWYVPVAHSGQQTENCLLSGPVQVPP